MGMTADSVATTVDSAADVTSAAEEMYAVDAISVAEITAEMADSTVAVTSAVEANSAVEADRAITEVTAATGNSTECKLPDGNWLEILDQISGRTEKCFLIVTSRLADASLWAEVLNLGGYDLLAKPFNRQEVRHVLTSAWVQSANPVHRTCTTGAS